MEDYKFSKATFFELITLDSFSSEFILIHINNKINVGTGKANNLFKIEALKCCFIISLSS